LARELVAKPDLLLLDEPTTHLGRPGIVWLEQLLRAAPFGYLVATHDRAFLRAVADEVIEINRVFPGGAFRAPGSYDEYVDRREEFLEAQVRKQEAVANRVRAETDWLAHKARARTRKSAARVDAAAQRRAALAELDYRATAAAGAECQRRNRNGSRRYPARRVLGEAVSVLGRAARRPGRRAQRRRTGARPHRPAHGAAGRRTPARRTDQRPRHPGAGSPGGE